MTIFHRQGRRELDRLVEDYTQHAMSRRSFLQRAMAVGLTASSASALLAACSGNSTSGNSDQGTKIDLITTWSDDEITSFAQVKAPFEQKNKVIVNVESTHDLNATLTTRLKANNPPDIAVLPNPRKMQELAAQNKLKPLNSFIDMTQFKKDYTQSWIDLGSYQNNLYAIFYKAVNKGTVWYNPTQFQNNNYEIPRTWNEMITLSDQIANKGQYPWSIGVESGASSGWPAADWVAQIFLLQSGPDLYDQWVQHKIPWTHEAVKNAFKAFGQIVGRKHYVNSAPQSVLATNFQQSVDDPYSNPPRSFMVYMGGFAEGIITAQYPDATPGTDFNFFPFPEINSQFANSMTSGADVMVALTNNNTVQQCMSYLATADAQTIWVKRGGFTAVNKSVDLNAYPNEVDKASAQMLTNAQTFRYGVSDLIPSAVQTAFWKGLLSFISDQTKLNTNFNNIQSTAKTSYNQ
jgi:alpha-glucoside transport system substrate-binding protein